MRILMISHDASRTGAPISLLSFIKWLRARNLAEVDLVVLGDGPLMDEFTNVCSSVTLSKDESDLSALLLFLKRVARKLGHQPVAMPRAILKLAEKGKYDAVYANTVLSALALCEIAQVARSTKLFLHVRELSSLTTAYSDHVKGSRDAGVKFITVSKIAAQELGAAHKIPLGEIALIPPFINQIRPKNLPDGQGDKQSFVVNGAGLAQIRKGFEYFIAIAIATRRGNPESNIVFRWVGSVPKAYEQAVHEDLTLCGYKGLIDLVGEMDDPIPHFTQGDLFLMTSRADPFPRVGIEHAMLGKPIICFDGATGLTELTASGAGVSVPHADIQGAAAVILDLSANQSKYDAMAARALEISSDYELDAVCTRACKVMGIATIGLQE